MKYIDAKWHYPQNGEYPVIYGEYEHKHYPQIPCLVFYHGMYGVRFWNCTEECWDDEECDDFYCSKEEVEKWMYIDSLQQEQPCEDLTTEIEKYFQGLWPGMETAEQCNTDMHFTPPAIMRLARHFAEWQKEQMIRDCSVQASYEAEIEKAEERGYNLCKEQMIKQAVEGEAEELYNDGEIHCTVGVGTYFKPGDEVYVIKKED